MRRVRLTAAAGLAAVLALAAAAARPVSAGAGSLGSEAAPSPSCPARNPPDEMQLVAGSPQSATLGSAFATEPEVTLANSNGCPVSGAAGTPVTFTAPASGPSGTFSASGSSAVTVGADSQGAASAPPFSANTIAGSYTVSAVSAYGSVSFSLSNSPHGVPARLLAVSPARGTATVLSRYATPLQVRVLDASGAPAAGVSVTFTLTASPGPEVCRGSQAAGASFTGGSAQAIATTNAAGVATSPPLTANAGAGSFLASAAISSASSASPYPAPAPVAFSLKNLAGKPQLISAGVGATQFAALGQAFPIRLAVSVTDAQRNPVPGAPVTFSAPTRPPSGRFLVHSHRRLRASSRVQVRSDGCGVALAPVFTAGQTAGGYVVKASVGHAHSVAFALVNRAA
jgi:hypothetical protein